MDEGKLKEFLEKWTQPDGPNSDDNYPYWKKELDEIFY